MWTHPRDTTASKYYDFALNLTCNVFYAWYFQICMGSGTCVRASASSTWLNINIDGFPGHQMMVTGLCGNFNGDFNDDLMSPDGTLMSCSTPNECRTYMRTWRVPRDQDLFNTFISAQPPSTAFPIPELCACEAHLGQDVTCGLPSNTGNQEDNLWNQNCVARVIIVVYLNNFASFIRLRPFPWPADCFPLEIFCRRLFVSPLFFCKVCGSADQTGRVQSYSSC